MTALLQTMHNIQVHTMAAADRQLVWIEMGQGVPVTPEMQLFAFSDRQDDTQAATLRLVLRYPAGNVMTAHTPEGLRYLTTDAVVRNVESDAHGPVRVLVEIGDMVGFPSLRADAA